MVEDEEGQQKSTVLEVVTPKWNMIHITFKNNNVVRYFIPLSRK